LAKAINVSICDCGKFLDKHSWVAYHDVHQMLVKKIRNTYPKAKVVLPEFEPPVEQKQKVEIHVKVTAKKNETFNQAVIMKMSKCNLCEKEGGKYFEAIFQLRGRNEEILQEAIEYLRQRIANLRQRGLFVNKVEKQENGFDMYMTSNKMAQILGRELLDKFGGNLKVNPRLFSKDHQTSKDLYRVNVFIELPQFTRGQYILYDDKVWLVEKISRKIKLIDLQSGSAEIVDYDKIEYKPMKVESAYVSKTYPHLEVLNPNDYQSTMVKNKPKKDFAVGQSIGVIIHKGIFVVE
jgi:nonsense-mediated mRNA decay protein 3